MHPRWCRISSINSSIHIYIYTHIAGKPIGSKQKIHLLALASNNPNQHDFLHDDMAMDVDSIHDHYRIQAQNSPAKPTGDLL